MGEGKKYHSIILAAGYGTRLAPVTDEIPKPLIPVGNMTLLDNILHKLDQAGVAKFAVNTHHLGEMIACAVGKSKWQDRVILYPEEEILGTGGPLVNAKKFLSQSDSFVLHNGDIFTDMDMSQLLKFHEQQNSPITMVMIDGPENKCAVDENGWLVDILGKLGREAGFSKLTYAGIAVFKPEILDFLPEKPEFCSIVTAILKMMEENPQAVAAYCPGNIYWNDLGTVEKFLDAQNDIAAGKIKLTEITPTIPMPVASLPHPGGSDRMFFRRKCPFSPDGEGKIIMCASHDSEDFDRFLKIGGFLDKLDLGVPKILNSSSERHVVIMEDLGNDILFNRLQQRVSGNEKEALYKQIIEWLVKFQSETYEKYCVEGEIEPDKVGIRLFDFDYLRWETAYFAENFLVNFCELRKNEVDELDEEFDLLAQETLSQPQVLIHRDFQSQNILFKDGKVRIVDFQGARIGHICYDLMSLLKDPYVEISPDLRNSLFMHYFATFSESSLIQKMQINSDEFAKLSVTAGLQRNMQALGAYCFLSLRKGKKEYLDYIPKGLEYLKDGLKQMQQANPDCPLPKLSQLVAGIVL